MEVALPRCISLLSKWIWLLMRMNTWSIYHFNQRGNGSERSYFGGEGYSNLAQGQEIERSSSRILFWATHFPGEHPVMVDHDILFLTNTL